MPQSPNHGVSQIAIVYRSRTAWRTERACADTPSHLRRGCRIGGGGTCAVGAVGRTGGEFGCSRSSTGSPQPALTKEATCTLEVTGLTNDPPIPVPAMAEKMHSFAQYMETSSTRSFIDSRQSHTDAPLSKFAALATTVAPITDMKARKKASNDDRLLRFRFRTHFGSA